MQFAAELSEREVQTCLNCESIEGSLDFLVMVSRPGGQPAAGRPTHRA